jgi:hypothetical protein
MSDRFGPPQFVVLSLRVQFHELNIFSFPRGDFPRFIVEFQADRDRPELVTSSAPNSLNEFEDITAIGPWG